MMKKRPGTPEEPRASAARQECPSRESLTAEQNIKSPTPVLLVLSNVPALIGLVAFGWGMKDLVLLYWLETIVIGIFSILKTLIARSNPDVIEWLSGKGRLVLGAYKLLMVFLVTVLVGVYALVTGLAVGFMLVVMDYGLHEMPDGITLPDYLYGQAAAQNIWIALEILCLSHAASFFYNFIYRKEYLVNQDRKQVEILGRRVGAIVYTVVPCIILFAVFLSIEGLVSRDTMAMLRKGPAMLLIIFKTFFDYQTHREEHGLRGVAGGSGAGRP